MGCNHGWTEEQYFCDGEHVNPTKPRITGTLSGVGGRLALTESGLLYSTARSVFGGDTELGGVRTAALGNVALIEGTEPAILVAGEGPRAAEAFALKYRVIPADNEIGSAKIEWRIDQATHSVIDPVPVVNGRGQVSLPLGFTVPNVVRTPSRACALPRR